MHLKSQREHVRNQLQSFQEQMRDKFEMMATKLKVLDVYYRRIEFAINRLSMIKAMFVRSMQQVHAKMNQVEQKNMTLTKQVGNLNTQLSTIHAVPQDLISQMEKEIANMKHERDFSMQMLNEHKQDNAHVAEMKYQCMYGKY